jgi:NAD(P)-dependent dehydrogenase (short-subunit alcohol dehydrogenase family)
MTGRLDGKVVLINGGSQGVGAAVARAAVREGAQVVVTGRRVEVGEPGEAFPPGAPHHFFMDRFAQAYRAELGAFLDVAMGLRASPCPPEEALEVAWIAEAATMSVHQHRPIRMDEVRA